MRHDNANHARQKYIRDETQQEYYAATKYFTEQTPYPDTAAAHYLHQQHVALEQQQISRVGIEHNMHTNGHLNNKAQYTDMKYCDRIQQISLNNNVDSGGTKNLPIVREGDTKLPTIQGEINAGIIEQQHQHQQEGTVKDERNDDERYAEIYEEVFAPRSRTPSGLRTLTEHTFTEHTRGIISQAQTTLGSRSTSRSGSSSSSSSTIDMEFGDNWEENIMSALNDMAGNLKKIGGIHCNQAGPDSTEVQLKLNLPLPMEVVDRMDVAAKEGFNNAMATLSPKKCNMQYGDYSHLDDQVFEMEERFVGTMDQLQGNVMPVYKSLFQNQSDSFDDEDDEDEAKELEDESQSTYEDPRFLPKIPQTFQQQQQQQQQVHTKCAVDSSGGTDTIHHIPSHIIISDQSSGISSNNSWKLLSPRDKPHEYPTKSTKAEVIISTIDNNLDVAIRDSRVLSDQKGGNCRNTQWIPATTKRMKIDDRENFVIVNDSIQSNQPSRHNEPIVKRGKISYDNTKVGKAKLKIRNSKSLAQIPHMIDCVHDVEDGQDIPECYSDLTVDIRKSASKVTTKTPTIKTHFSGDEIMGCSKASFQRNSINKGILFDPKSKILRTSVVESDSSGNLPKEKSNAIESSAVQEGDEIDTEKIILESDPLPDHQSCIEVDKPMDAQKIVVDEKNQITRKEDLHSTLNDNEEAPDDELMNSDSKNQKVVFVDDDKATFDNTLPNAATNDLTQEESEKNVVGSLGNDNSSKMFSGGSNSKIDGAQISCGLQNNDELSKNHYDVKDNRPTDGEPNDIAKRKKMLNEKAMTDIEEIAETKAERIIEEERQVDEANTKNLENEQIEEERKRSETKKELEMKKIEEEKEQIEDEEKRRKELEAREAEASVNKALEADIKAEEERKQIYIDTEADDAKVKSTFKVGTSSVEDVCGEDNNNTQSEHIHRIHEEEKHMPSSGNKATGENNQGKNDIHLENAVAEKSSGRASIYQIQGFDDYCKSLSITQAHVTNNEATLSKLPMSIGRNHVSDVRENEEGSSHLEVKSLDIRDAESYKTEERAGLDIQDYNDATNSICETLGSSEEASIGAEISDVIGTRNSNSEESDIYTDATSYVEDFEEDDTVLEMMANNQPNNLRSRTSINNSRRNKIDIQSERVEIKYISKHNRPESHLFPSEATVNTSYTQSKSVITMDETVQSLLTRDTSLESAASIRSKLKTLQRTYLNDVPLNSSMLKPSYTTDMPIALTSTMSTMQTFDQDTVYSGHYSLGRYKQSDESISYSHRKMMSTVNPVVTYATSSLRTTKRSNNEPRHSILSWIVSLIQRAMISIILFSFAWIKHLMSRIGRKRPTKIGCAPTQFAFEPDQACIREEIQDRSMDSLIHQTNSYQQHHRHLYFDHGHHNHKQDHYTTTMLMKPAGNTIFIADDVDEVGTCVESIVPDTHYPSKSDGKNSTWKIAPTPSSISLLSSPSSTSFGVLKKAYSAFSYTKRNENEETNWLDQDTIDDEIASYYY